MDKMTIKSRIHDYNVEFVRDPRFLEEFGDISTHYYIVDSVVWAYYGHDVLSHVEAEHACLLSVDEDHKTLETVQQIYDFVIDRSIKRNSVLVCVGGGSIQDVAGFAASTLFRGLSWIFVPTTLLAQADSCIGGKTSLNYKQYKNLIGTFFPPSDVKIYPHFLSTISEMEYYSGLGEVIKMHLVGGEETTRSMLRLLPEIQHRSDTAVQACIEGSLEIKASFISADEFDHGKRRFLNYGHCFGHALETTSRFAIPHGQAVVIGMLLANIVARRRGLLSESSCKLFASDLFSPCLKYRMTDQQMQVDAVIDAMSKDKKRVSDGLAVVLLCDGYDLQLATDIEPPEIRAALEEFGSYLS